MEVTTDIHPERSKARKRAPRARVSSEPVIAAEPELKEFGATFIERKPASSNTSFIKGVIIIVGIALVAGLVGFATQKGMMPSFGRRSDEFKAVFLVNGQVYFGTIEKQTSEEVTLANVFYVQLVPQQVTGADGTVTTVQQPQLIKKGEEFYGPEGSIQINRDQVTVIENMREDTDIMRQIRERL